MGNTHAWHTYLTAPSITVLPTINVSLQHRCSTLLIDKFSEFLKQSGMSDADIQTVSKHCEKVAEKKTQFIQFTSTMNNIHVNRFDVWATKSDAKTFDLQVTMIAAQAQVSKFQDQVTTRDGELRESRRLPLGLSAPESQAIVNFVTAELTKRYITKKVIVGSELRETESLTVVPPKIAVS